ncbi:hypothetical protein Adu01nite_84810 [Paractinoplanes durhamensis]|uniref:Radical SAM core domain-containing protein n=1 Tax=Paractinoplanes durhamensis TaxID=113563 RepID=A0ABQ3ZBH3_9ACTN|nr:hypothetical protein Adu01nite_84810 [Actinoplanes durhamensis]
MARAHEDSPPSGLGKPGLTQYVLKVHSRCDLACDHCYVYEHADQSWRGQPMIMASSTVVAAAQRIAEHAVAHGLHAVHVVLHGGEPLLLGFDGLDQVIRRLRSIVDPVVPLRLSLQTNGIGLTPAICDLFVRERVGVGVSLDGDRAANDRHRRFRNGGSSYDRVRAALRLLRRPEFRAAYAGILCTIDVRNDPIDVYEAVRAEEPPRIEFLLPHATWDNPPPRPDGSATPYADWLLRIHRRWTDDGRPVPIRILDSLESTARGGPSHTEALGLDPVDVLVVESDGAWEQADSLKIAYHGAAATARTVFTHSVDETLGHPGLAARLTGLDALCAQCRSCPVVARCGGGLFAHRYRTGTGFANPSVFCADLKELMESTSMPPSPGEPPTAAIPADVIEEIATGHVSVATVDLLDQLQAELVEALLEELADTFAPVGDEHPWAALVRMSGDDPRTVREILGHPYVRVWADRCLRRQADPRLLGNLAAAAAIRTGRPATVQVVSAGGYVRLPAVAAVAVPGPAGLLPLTVGEAGTVSIAGRPLEPAAWSPVRHADTGAWSPALDDVDAHRDCFEWPVLPRLDEAAHRRWTSTLTAAYRIVADEAAGHLPGLTAGLRVITPLQPGADGSPRAATAREAYPAIGLAYAGPAEMAVLMVHEFQHVKLGALADHVDLYDPGFQARFRVGWRPDPRPVEGVLHGAYAHLAVAELWRSRPGEPAREKYLHYRDWTAEAAETLLASGALTGSGERFVRRLAQTLNSPAP